MNKVKCATCGEEFHINHQNKNYNKDMIYVEIKKVDKIKNINKLIKFESYYFCSEGCAKEYEGN